MNLTTAAASAASLSGASTNPRNCPRFLMSETTQVCFDLLLPSGVK
jgi:hypothetical protein